MFSRWRSPWLHIRARAAARRPDDACERAAIADVLHAYCDAVDEARLDDLLALFTTDCRFDRGFGAVYAGRREIAELIGASMALYGASSHHLSNIRVWFDGPAAARTSSYVYARYRYAESGEIGQLWGRYRDRLVKLDGRWLLAERSIRIAAWEDPARDDRLRFEPMQRGTGTADV